MEYKLPYRRVAAANFIMPEKVLLMAIIQNAIIDAQEEWGRECRAARAWLLGHAVEYEGPGFTFEQACYYLGLNATRTRRCLYSRHVLS